MVRLVRERRAVQQLRAEAEEQRRGPWWFGDVVSVRREAGQAPSTKMPGEPCSVPPFEWRDPCATMV